MTTFSRGSFDRDAPREQRLLLIPARDGERIRFSSGDFAAVGTRSLDALLPVLYRRGI